MPGSKVALNYLFGLKLGRAHGDPMQADSFTENMEQGEESINEFNSSTISPS